MVVLDETDFHKKEFVSAWIFTKNVISAHVNAKIKPPSSKFSKITMSSGKVASGIAGCSGMHL